jgi:hypothetical protein
MTLLRVVGLKVVQVTMLFDLGQVNPLFSTIIFLNDILVFLKEFL